MFVSRIGAQAGRISRNAPKCRSLSTQADYNQQHINLAGVPHLTTPGDIRRAIAGKLQGVADVEMHYFRFRPSGRALITLTRHEFLRDNLRALEKLTLCGIPIKAYPANSREGGSLPRSRGSKGRAEAAGRGVINGTGPQGNFPNVERNCSYLGFAWKTRGPGS
ncbi:hypothetical protein FPV67DRAFT_286852 [Lyophyllum atratum]|nr:hypothetical protein FPV67DRAFT_286852 [Lyophyllum atratum]